MKIVLLGYMGSGKSAIGKQLAQKMHLQFIDLDFYIEEQEKTTIKLIFEQKGEIYFRLIEHRYLKEILDTKDKFILSLGGGTPCYANNMDMINNTKATSIYLKTSLKTLVDRLLPNKEKRPLIAHLSAEKINEFIAKHLFERQFYYEKATYKVENDHKQKEEVVAEIRILLR